MFGSIKKLFTGSESLVALGKSGKSVNFAERFSSAEIMFLTLPIPNSVDPSSMSQDELLQLMEKAANQISTDKSVVPFTYNDSSARTLPIFTNQKAAEHFAGKYATEINRVLPFGLMTVAGRTLTPGFNSNMRVLLNAKSDAEYCLSSLDIDELRKV